MEANLVYRKRSGPTGYAIGDRGSDCNPFTCVREDGGVYMEANPGKSETNSALCGALWVGSKLGWKARRHSVGLRVGGAGPPKEC